MSGYASDDYLQRVSRNVSVSLLGAGVNPQGASIAARCIERAAEVVPSYLWLRTTYVASEMLHDAIIDEAARKEGETISRTHLLGTWTNPRGFPSLMHLSPVDGPFGPTWNDAVSRQIDVPWGARKAGTEAEVAERVVLHEAGHAIGHLLERAGLKEKVEEHVWEVGARLSADYRRMTTGDRISPGESAATFGISAHAGVGAGEATAESIAGYLHDPRSPEPHIVSISQVLEKLTRHPEWSTWQRNLEVEHLCDVLEGPVVNNSLVAGTPAVADLKAGYHRALDDLASDGPVSVRAIKTLRVLDRGTSSTPFSRSSEATARLESDLRQQEKAITKRRPGAQVEQSDASIEETVTRASAQEALALSESANDVLRSNEAAGRPTTRFFGRPIVDVERVRRVVDATGKALAENERETAPVPPAAVTEVAAGIDSEIKIVRDLVQSAENRRLEAQSASAAEVVSTPTPPAPPPRSAAGRTSPADQADSAPPPPPPQHQRRPAAAPPRRVAPDTETNQGPTQASGTVTSGARRTGAAGARRRTAVARARTDDEGAASENPDSSTLADGQKKRASTEAESDQRDKSAAVTEGRPASASSAEAPDPDERNTARVAEKPAARVVTGSEQAPRSTTRGDGGYAGMAL